MDFEDECQYKVLDEVVEENEEDSPQTTEDIASDVESSAEDFDIDEIDAMLDENMTGKEDFSKKSKDCQNKETEPNNGEEVTRLQLVDSDKMSNEYFALPFDWIMLKHVSGMPIYLNRKTRSCSLSRPYVVPSGPVRSHKIPICAIPCLQYRKILEDKKKGSDTIKNDQPNEKNKDDEVKSDNMVDIQENVSNIGNNTSNNIKCPYISNSSIPGKDDEVVKSVDAGTSEIVTLNESNTAKIEESKTSEVEESKTSEVEESKTPEVEESKTPEVEESKTSEVEESKTSEVEESKSPEAEKSKILEAEESKIGGVKELKTVNNHEDGSNNMIESKNEDVMDTEKTQSTSSKFVEGEVSSRVIESSHGVNSGESSQESSISSRFANPELAAALNIINKPTHSAKSLLPTEGAEVCIVEQVRPVLSAEQFHDYCSKLFLFENVKVNLFPNWSSKRKAFRERHENNSKEEENEDASVTKIITIKNKEARDFLKKRRSKWVLNPKSKSPVCILHEYVQYVFKSLPEYSYEVLENSSTPYAATVKINDLAYATGYGSSKRGAKTQASKETLKIIMPEILESLDEEGNDGSKFFDTVSLLDPSVPKLCQTMSELPPYSILLNCLKKNNALENVGVKIRVVTKANQKNEFIMTAGKHTVSVTCKNKKEGRQFASQALLQKLHPHIDSWGSMVRLYGESAYSEIQQKKKEQMEVTSLQNNANPNQPNFSIINLLKKEMLKLAEKRKNMQPLTEFVPPEHVRLPNPSSSNLNTLDF